MKLIQHDLENYSKVYGTWKGTEVQLVEFLRARTMYHHGYSNSLPGTIRSGVKKYAVVKGYDPKNKDWDQYPFIRDAKSLRQLVELNCEVEIKHPKYEWEYEIAR